MCDDFLLNAAQRDIQRRASEFARDGVSKDLLKAMDREEVQYPREFLVAAGQAGLLGLRFPKEWGGADADWVTEVAALEEIGVLGASLAFMEPHTRKKSI